MSSRGDHRRHERDWERDDRDRDRDRYSRGGGRGRGRGGHYKDEPRRRSSRSRSPRRSDRDRRSDRKDYRRDEDRHHRDDDRRDDRRHRERDGDKDRDKRDGKDDRRRDEREYPRGDRKGEGRKEEPGAVSSAPSEAGERNAPVASQPPPTNSSRPQPGGSNVESNDVMDGQEEGEAPDDMTEDDAAMMAMMGVTGFGSTKGKHVTGNQEGSVDIKKVRTWRQYMNRRGGFNRPLDKIK